MGFGDGSGISWTIYKQSAPPSRQITTPAPHHSIFMGRMHFLTPNQQCHSTEGKTTHKQTDFRTRNLRSRGTHLCDACNVV